MNYMKYHQPTLAALHPKLAHGFLLLVGFLWVMGQFQRWHLTPTIAFYLHDMVLAAWLVISLGVYQRHTWHQLRRWQTAFFLQPRAIKNLVYVLLGLSVMGWLGSGLSGEPILPALLYVCRFGVYLTSIGLLITASQLSEALVQKWLWLAGMYVLGLSLIQYFVIPDTRFLIILGWDDHYYRALGSWFDPAFVGALTVLLLVLTEKLGTHSAVLVTWLTRLFIALVLALTFSRASYLSLAAALVCLAAAKLSWHQAWKYAGLGILTLLFIWMAPRPSGEGVNLSRTVTIQTRVSTSQRWLADWTAREVLVGNGPFVNTLAQLPQPIAKNDHANQPDNLVVWSLNAWGITGTVLAGIVTAYYLRRWWYSQTWLIISLVAILVHSLFNNTLFQPFIFGWLCVATWSTTLSEKSPTSSEI